MNRERLKGHLDLLLLSVLTAGPAHGYAVISERRSRREGTFDLPEGTVYPALHRLEDAGLLSSSWARADGRRRRGYALTGPGAAALAAGQTEYRSLTRAILAEAEDHLHEAVTDGLAAGLTLAQAQEQAVSGFGPVRAVVRAHDA